MYNFIHDLAIDISYITALAMAGALLLHGYLTAVLALFDNATYKIGDYKIILTTRFLNQIPFKPSLSK